MFRKRVAVIVLRVIGPLSLPKDFLAGPLPIVMSNGRFTDTESRRTYFSSRAADALYGQDELGDGAVRWHRVCQGTNVLGSHVEAVELLVAEPLGGEAGAEAPARTAGYLLLCHLTLPEDQPLEALHRWVDLAPESRDGKQSREAVVTLVGGDFEIPASCRRATSVTFLTFSGPPPPLTPDGGPRSWDPRTQWLWWAACATSFLRFPPDPEDPSLLAGTVYLSQDWRALVLRDGIGFLGLRDDDRDAGSFLPSAEAYVRSIYTDVVLLALLQREVLEGLADRLARIGFRSTQPDLLQSLVDDLTEFRNVFWWETVTLHGVANEILQRLQVAHGTPVLFDRVVADVRNFAAQIEYHASLRSAEIQEDNRKRAERLEKVGAAAAISFALPALVIAVLSIPITGLTDAHHSVSLGVVSVVVALALMVGVSIGLFITTILPNVRKRPNRPASPPSSG